MQGRYESKLENSTNGFGAILWRVEFQTDPIGKLFTATCLCRCK